MSFPREQQSSSTSSSAVVDSLSLFSSVSHNHNTIVRKINKNGSNSTPLSSTASCTIPNFRQALGLRGKIYRCASPDESLANFLSSQSSSFARTSATSTSNSNVAIDNEKEVNSSYKNIPLLLSKVEKDLFFNSKSKTLVLDLRSPKERNDELAELWINHNMNNDEKTTLPSVSRSAAIIQDEEVRRIVRRTTNDHNTQQQSQAHQHGLLVLRINVITPSKLFYYLDQHWLSPVENEKEKNNNYHQENNIVNDHITTRTNIQRQKKELRRHVQTQTLHSKGLPGLYEAILETSKHELCIALQEITKHLEPKTILHQDTRTTMISTASVSSKNNNTININNKVVIHCVQGKDRTGILVMLCQSIMGLDDDDIIKDYTESNNAFPLRNKNYHHHHNHHQNPKGNQKKKSMDPNVFAGAPRKAIVTTLKWVRSKYGSVSPGYINAIGFDIEWQLRFKNAVHYNGNNNSDYKAEYNGQQTQQYEHDNLFKNSHILMESKL